LLRCLSGQDEPRSGEVRVLGARPRAIRERVAYVPPPETLNWDFPVSVGELVMTGRYGRLGLLGRPGPRDRAIVRASLERMSLARVADRRIGTLGSVERTRALLARALAREPRLMLLDEPWSVPGTRDDEALSLVEHDVRSAGGTVVVATGRLDEARRFDRIALMNGRIVADGRPEMVLTAENLRATFGDRAVLRPVRAESFAEDR
jgi:ABC-type Mn2+/Zn2+ transport system ATPase subunit